MTSEKTTNGQTIEEILHEVQVIPVLTVHRLSDAAPLARALVAGGLRCLEVTLRTPVALDAIRAMIAAEPDAIVGAGSVSRPRELALVRRAGARFAVSPAWSDALAAVLDEDPFPWLPGVATPSEALRARERGYSILKFFPAELMGGRAFLKALAGPLPDLRFCPTGGIGAAAFSSYLALPNVVCVGGSWVAPQSAIDSGDWAAITRLAAAAAEETRP